jgi:hypothetical protein
MDASKNEGKIVLHVGLDDQLDILNDSLAGNGNVALSLKTRTDNDSSKSSDMEEKLASSCICHPTLDDC